MTARRIVPAPSIKLVLWAGLALTLGLWTFTWYGLTTRMSDVESEANLINSRYTRAQDLLSTVRTQVMAGSLLARDALLDTRPSDTPRYQERFEDTYRAAVRALTDYVPVLDTVDEREGVARLRREVEAFHSAMVSIFDADPLTRSTRSAQLLRERVVPRREVAIRISQQVQTLNRQAFVAQNQATAQLYRDAQRQAWRQLGVALAASLAIALWAGLSANRLEARIRLQHARDAQMTSDLHRLSARLVSAQEDERRMIARELHDEVGQALAAIRVELSLAQRGEGQASLSSHLDHVRAITEGALHTIRDLSHLLHPAMLEDLGLVPAMESLVAGFTRRHGIAVEWSHHGLERRLPEPIEIMVYRIAQEALNNMARHSQATRGRIAVSVDESHLRMTLEDNGVGFAADDLQSLPSGGLGLIGIRERVAQFSGTMRLNATPGGGTWIGVDVPLGAPASDAEASAPSVPRGSLHGALANLPR